MFKVRVAGIVTFNAASTLLQGSKSVASSSGVVLPPKPVGTTTTCMWAKKANNKMSIDVCHCTFYNHIRIKRAIQETHVAEEPRFAVINRPT